MSALPLTVFLSLALAGLFTLLFWREHRRRHLGGAERDSLLPLADESPRPARAEPGHRHEHHHLSNGRPCGCRPAGARAESGRPGLHAPCPGCLRQAGHSR